MKNGNNWIQEPWLWKDRSLPGAKRRQNLLFLPVRQKVG